jgi:hypothetical protein
MGLGKIGIGPALDYGHENYTARKNMREGFALDNPSQGAKPTPRRIRNLTVENTDIWTNAFHAIQNDLVGTQMGVFHLFLMGCSVAGKKDSVDTTLLRKAAEQLYVGLQMPVCVSAPTDEIDDNHLDNLLERFETIRQDCANGKDVFLKNKSDPTPTRREKRRGATQQNAGVKLLSYRYNGN